MASTDRAAITSSKVKPVWDLISLIKSTGFLPHSEVGVPLMDLHSSADRRRCHRKVSPLFILYVDEGRLDISARRYPHPSGAFKNLPFTGVDDIGDEPLPQAELTNLIVRNVSSLGAEVGNRYTAGVKVYIHAVVP